MYVTEELDCLMVYVVGETEEREMVENDRPALNDKDMLEFNAVKPTKHSTLPEHPLRVVVSENEMDMPVKPLWVWIAFQAPVPFLNVTEAEVSKMIHMVIWPDNGIPVSHDCLIHSFNGLKRPVAVFENVVVIKMS